MPPKETKEKVERVPIKSLRTYQGDIDEIMAKNKYSATTILVAEQKRKVKQENTPSSLEVAGKTEARNKTFVMLSGILLLLSIVTISAVYYIRNKAEVVTVQKTKALISFSQEKTFALTGNGREQLISRIFFEKENFKFPVNSVLYLNTTDGGESPAAVGYLLKDLAPSMPPSLLRSFDGEYMLGIYAYNTNEPFLILRTDDYALSYSGMLKWEKDILNDMGKMFGLNTSASGTNIFEDEAIRNKDLRVLKDKEGNTILAYSFIDKNTLVITKNEDVFNAILAKYVTSQNVR